MNNDKKRSQPCSPIRNQKTMSENARKKLKNNNDQFKYFPDIRSCKICKTSPMDMKVHIQHIFSAKHCKKLSGTNDRCLITSEQKRSLHVSGYNNKISIYAIVARVWKYGIIRVTECSDFSFFEFGSIAGKAAAINEKINIDGCVIKLSPKLSSMTNFKSKIPEGPPLSFHLKDCLSKKCNKDELYNIICRFIKEVSLDSNDINLRNNLKDKISWLLGQNYPSALCYLFGSSVNSLGFKGCDVDIFVNLGDDSWNLANNEKERQKILKNKTWELYRILIRNREFTNLVSIPFARVPIIKFFDQIRGLNCDLSFTSPMPVMNSRLIDSYANTHALVHPYLMIIRYWAMHQGIAGGGDPSRLLTNYALTMMMLFVLMQESIIPTVLNLQMASKALNWNPFIINDFNVSFYNDFSYKNRQHKLTIFDLVSIFFDFYSTFDASKSVICPFVGKLIPHELLKNKDPLVLGKEYHDYCSNINFPIEKGRSICVQDPFEHVLNITRGLKPDNLAIFQRKCNISLVLWKEIISGSKPLMDLFKYIEDDDNNEDENSLFLPGEINRLCENGESSKESEKVVPIVTINDSEENEDKKSNEIVIISEKYNTSETPNNHKDDAIVIKDYYDIISKGEHDYHIYYNIKVDEINNYFIIKNNGSVEKSNALNPINAVCSIINFLLKDCLLMESSTDIGWEKNSESDTATKSPCKLLKNINKQGCQIKRKYKLLDSVSWKASKDLWFGRTKTSKQVPLIGNPLEKELLITEKLLEQSHLEERINLEFSASVWECVELKNDILVTIRERSGNESKTKLQNMGVFLSRYLNKILMKTIQYVSKLT